MTKKFDGSDLAVISAFWVVVGVAATVGLQYEYERNSARILVARTGDMPLCLAVLNSSSQCTTALTEVVAQRYPRVRINWEICNDKAAVLSALAQAITPEAQADAVNAACRITPVAKAMPAAEGR